MIDLTTEQRFQIVSSFIEVYKAITEHSTKSIERIRRFIPSHQADITFASDDLRTTLATTRYFAPLSLKQHGKKRVYASMHEKRLPLYMFYLSKREIDKLDKRSNVEGGWLADMIGDRWFITGATHSFKNIFKLINNTVAVERKPSKSNHPPEGNDWICSDELIKNISRYRAMFPIRHVYGVSIEKFSINQED